MTDVLDVIGDVVPLAFVISLSPIPIVATILMLLSPNAKANGVAFLLGWLFGVVASLLLWTALAMLIPSLGGGGPLLGAGLTILLGVVVGVLGVRKLLKPRGADDEIPGWMSSIDSMTGARALGFGVVLAAANPKNIVVSLAAGIAIGASGLTIAEEFAVGAAFVAVAAFTVAVPVITYLAASSRLAQPLVSIRTWLVANNAVVMGVQSLVIGAVLVGMGIGRLG